MVLLADGRRTHGRLTRGLALQATYNPGTRQPMGFILGIIIGIVLGVILLLWLVFDLIF